LVIILVLTVRRGHAQVWTGGGADNAWENGANWMGGAAPVNGATTDVFLSGTTRLTPTAAAAITLRTLNFGADAGGFLLTAPAINLGVGGLANYSPAAQQVNANLNLTSTQTWTLPGGDLVVNGNLSGTLSQLTINGTAGTTINGSTSNFTLVNAGSGELVLSGPQPNLA
jgi:hypothetical protein